MYTLNAIHNVKKNDVVKFSGKGIDLGNIILGEVTQKDLGGHMSHVLSSDVPGSKSLDGSVQHRVTPDTKQAY